MKSENTSNSIEQVRKHNKSNKMEKVGIFCEWNTYH